MRFAETLEVGLDLTIGSETIKIPGGNVRSVELELHPWGLEGRVSFWVSQKGPADPDTLIAKFIKPDLMDVRISLKPEAAEAPTLVCKGLVTERALDESSFADIKRQKVLLREYTLWFRDLADVLWRQHRPTTLEADTDVASVIKKHAVGGLTVTVDLSDAKRDRGLVCLALGQGEATFYDFVHWYAESAGGGVWYDHVAGSYFVTGKKPKAAAPPILFDVHEVKPGRLRMPALVRRSARIHNAHTAASGTTAVAQDQAISGIYADHLLRSPVSAAVSERKAPEAARMRQPGFEIQVDHLQWPQGPVQPGALVGLQKEYFGDLLARGLQFRVQRLRLSIDADPAGPDHAHDAPARRYGCEASATWEMAEDGAFRRPGFAWPLWPIQVEGKIISDGGKAGDRIYMEYEDQDGGDPYYKIQVPLWNEKIRATFSPQGTAGHIYAPAFKDERCLVALWFDRAEIVQFLDWGTDVKLPADAQGNHLLFGKNADSQTSMKHIYVDSKPVFSIERVAKGDQGTLKIEDGIMLFEIKEDAAKAMAVETFDLLAQVAAAQEQLEAGTRAALGTLTGAFQGALGGASGELEAATTKTGAALEAMEAALAGQAEEAKAKVEGAVNQIADKVGELKGKTQAAVAELQQLVKL